MKTSKFSFWGYKGNCKFTDDQFKTDQVETEYNQLGRKIRNWGRGRKSRGKEEEEKEEVLAMYCKITIY